MNNLIKAVKVSNMNSPKSGHPVANQYIIETPEGHYFQSYRSVIAFIPKNVWQKSQGGIVLDKNYWDYSRTTGKYRNIFLNENTAETRKRIKRGEYTLEDLNG